MYRRYLTALTQIKNSSVPYDTICYEDFINNQIQYIADVPFQASVIVGRFIETVSLELPYQELCINYYEVKEKIRNKFVKRLRT
jgi:hypothetical protein